MAITPNYTQVNLLKKVTVGGATYFLKDEDLRTLVETFGDVVYKDVKTTLTPEGANVVTEKAIADYIKDQLGGIGKAMRFMGVVDRGAEEPAPDDKTAIAAHYAEKQEEPAAGDVVIMKDNAKEYIYNGAEWEEVGDQNIYLTIAEAAKTYVPNTRTIAGKVLNADITKEDLSGADALDLKALAHKAEATGTVEVVTSAADLTVAKSGAYTVAGDEVDVPATFNAMDVTAAGDVDLTAGVAAAATYEKANAATITATAPGPDEAATYTPEGKIALPSVTTTVSLAEEAVDTVTDPGTGYSITTGSATKAEDEKAKFVKKGVSFNMDAEGECLTLAYVEDTQNGEFYGDAVTAAGDVSYTAPVLSGALPTFGTKNVAKATGATGTTEFGGAATFTGTGAKISAKLGYETADAAVTQPTFTAKFTGTIKNVTPSAATSVKAQAPKGTITVTTTTAPITLNKETKTVTVK